MSKKLTKKFAVNVNLIGPKNVLSLYIDFAFSFSKLF